MYYVHFHMLIYTLLTCFMFWFMYCIIRGYVSVTWHGKSSKTYDSADEHVQDKDYDSHLTPLEQERLQDMMEFDARIASLKEEVAKTLPDVRRESPHVAQESDGVRNLPHNAVYIRPSPNMLEVAD